MITVQIQPDRHAAAAEFFELFKTDWKLYAPGDPCEILLTDGTDPPPDTPIGLCLIFSPQQLSDDRPSSRASAQCSGFRLVQLPNGTVLPVYTASTLFSGVGNALMCEMESGLALAYADHRCGRRTLRIGYDLFEETTYLLTSGQPVENAGIPALDHHIDFLRKAILNAGLPLVEIPPTPPGHPYMVCLTHDVDFVGIRNHGLNRTFQGFAYRALVGSLQRRVKKRLTWRQVLTNFRALFSVPLIHLGMRKDFWMQFSAYRQLEAPYRSTFFLIPFKDRPGQKITHAHAKRRGARYELADIRTEVKAMQDEGWEFGLHGIDAWHDARSASQEKARLTSFLQETCTGTRIHWLCRNVDTDRCLDAAGFEFDSTSGYNETIGFRAGTAQVFKPLSARTLLEIPLHIQDVALFYPDFLDLDEAEAWTRCTALLEHQQKVGGVLTLLWHMRSIAPERLWGGFYKRLLEQCAHDQAWVGTARETADWFRIRRQIKLSSRIGQNHELLIIMRSRDPGIGTPIAIRIYPPGPHPATVEPPYTDIVWNGEEKIKTGIYKTSKMGWSQAGRMAVA